MPCILGLMIQRVDRVRWNTRADLAPLLLEVRARVEGGEDAFARIADSVGMSEFALRRAFREVFGATPAQIEFGARMRRAESALSQGMSTQEAALEAGFQSPSSFCRAFRRHRGTSPAAYKRASSAHHRERALR